MIERVVIERAIRAYYQRCERDGVIYQQPSAGLSSVEGDHVVLCNGYGELARYRITKSGLRWVDLSA